MTMALNFSIIEGNVIREQSYITVLSSKNQMYISRKALHDIGNPTHITFGWDAKNRAIAIFPAKHDTPHCRSVNNGNLSVAHVFQTVIDIPQLKDNYKLTLISGGDKLVGTFPKKEEAKV